MKQFLCLLTFVVYVTADIGLTGQNQYLPPNKGYNYERPNVPFGSAPAPQTVIPSRPLPPPSPNPGYLPPAGPAGPGDHHHHHEPGMPFEFNYAVSDYPSANQQSHKAASDGDVTRGEYRVNLPDGRTQIVRYTADWKNGYNAEVSYEGEAHYPPPNPPQGLYGPPSNNAQNQGYIY